MFESTMPAPALQKCTQLNAESYAECHKNTNQDILGSNTVTLPFRSCTSQHEHYTNSYQGMFKVISWTLTVAASPFLLCLLPFFIIFCNVLNF